MMSTRQTKILKLWKTRGLKASKTISYRMKGKDLAVRVFNQGKLEEMALYGIKGKRKEFVRYLKTEDTKQKMKKIKPKG